MKSKLIKGFSGITSFSDCLMLIMALFTVTFFVYKDFGIRMLLGYGALCAVFAIHFLRRLILKKPLNIPTGPECMLTVAAVTVFIMFCRLDSRHDEDTLVYVLSMIICMGFLLFASTGRRELNIISVIFIISAVLFTAFVFFFAFNEELFWQSYFPLLSRASKTYLLKYVSKGYSPVLGGSCTVTDYVIVLGIAAVVGYMLSKKLKGIKGILAFIPICLFILAIMLVGRRGELLAIGLAVVFIYFAIQPKKQLIIKLSVLVILAVTALILFVVFLEELKEIDLLKRYVMTVEDLLSGNDTSSGRTELYALGFSIFLKSPIFGIGWGSFSDHVPDAFREAHGESVSDVHNIYLQFLCETGIVGTALILTPLVYIFIKTVRQASRLYKVTERSSDIVLAARMNGISLTLQTFFLLVGMLDPCFSKNIFWCFYVLAVGLLGSAIRLEGRTETDRIAVFFHKAISAVKTKVVKK